jgi:hypothetical protein
MAKKNEFEFKGYWSTEEKEEVGARPWETFRVHLFGVEAGDFADSPVHIREILEASGYELILRKIVVEKKPRVKKQKHPIELAEIAEQQMLDCEGYGGDE